MWAHASDADFLSHTTESYSTNIYAILHLPFVIFGSILLLLSIDIAALVFHSPIELFLSSILLIESFLSLVLLSREHLGKFIHGKSKHNGWYELRNHEVRDHYCGKYGRIQGVVASIHEQLLQIVILVEEVVEEASEQVTAGEGDGFYPDHFTIDSIAVHYSL